MCFPSCPSLLPSHAGTAEIPSDFGPELLGYHQDLSFVFPVGGILGMGMFIQPIAGGENPSLEGSLALCHLFLDLVSSLMTGRWAGGI